MSVIAWTEIEGFANIRKYALAHPEILNGNSTVNYMCKTKLHGMNHAVQCHSDGRVIPQSRTVELSVENDNAGFAKWVKSHETEWGLKFNNIVFFGEWIGKGIQSGVACSDIPEKSFAIFAAKYLDGSDDLIMDPGALLELLQGVEIPNIYVIPWHTHALEHGADRHVFTRFSIDWAASDEELSKITEEVNRLVLAVETEDPWVREVFDVKGVGEGLVFYPVSVEHTGYNNFKNLTFKAKGAQHRVIKTAAPAQVNVEVAASVNAFVEMVLTPARLEQGAEAVFDGSALSTSVIYQNKLTGKFLQWIASDIQKECQDELEASKLDFKQVSKLLGEKARQWYLSKC